MRGCMLSPSAGRRVVVRDLVDGLTASDAERLLGDNVRTGSCVIVTHLHQDPSALTGLCQSKAAGELGTLEDEREVVRLFVQDLRRALVPDDHRARSTR